MGSAFKEMRLDQNPTVRPAHPNELEADILTPTSLVTAAGLDTGYGNFGHVGECS